MADRVRAFLDTNVLFAAVLSATGGARMILKLGKAGAVHLQVGPQVLREADRVLTRKSPENKALFVLLVERAGVNVGPEPDAARLAQAGELVAYAPDARILAEALAAEVDYFVTLDRLHFVDNLDPAKLTFAIGTPGDFLAWLRGQMTKRLQQVEGEGYVDDEAQ
jgi:predicted nucleic acid-binding protein